MKPSTNPAPPPGPQTAALLQRRAAVVARGVPQVSNIVVDHANGALLVDVEGRSYIDMASGIGVMTAGHCQPEVLAAMARQAARLQHTCFHIATYDSCFGVFDSPSRSAS